MLRSYARLPKQDSSTFNCTHDRIVEEMAMFRQQFIRTRSLLVFLELRGMTETMVVDTGAQFVACAVDQ